MAAEPEIEAVREQLASWLLSQLQTQFPTVEILSSWPNGPVLPEFAILVQATGEADLMMHAPRVWTVSNIVGASGTVTYAYGHAYGIQLELDAWASSKPDRDALQLAIRRALNQPPQATITGAEDGRPRLSRRANLTLTVGNLFNAPFTYRFHAVPTIDENSGVAQRNEWRSHFRGTADGPLLEQDTIAMMLRLHLTGQIGPGAPGAGPAKQAIAADRPGAQTQTIVAPNRGALGPGQTLQLKAYAVARGGVITDVTATATWGSSDVTKATVSSSGLVTRVAAGGATITATSGGFPGTCVVATA